MSRCVVCNEKLKDSEMNSVVRHIDENGGLVTEPDMMCRKCRSTLWYTEDDTEQYLDALDLPIGD